MFTERGEGYIRPSDFPNVDVEVDHQATAGDMMSSLRTPFDTYYRGNGSNPVDVFDVSRVGKIPDLEKKYTRVVRLSRKIIFTLPDHKRP